MNVKENPYFNVNAAVGRSKKAGYKKANFTQNAIIEHQNCASVLRVIAAIPTIVRQVLQPGCLNLKIAVEMTLLSGVRYTGYTC